MSTCYLAEVLLVTEKTMRQSSREQCFQEVHAHQNAHSGTGAEVNLSAHCGTAMKKGSSTVTTSVKLTPRPEEEKKLL